MKPSMISTNRNDFLGIWTRELTSKSTYVNFEMFSIKKYVNFTFKENYNANWIYIFNYLPNLFSNNNYFLKSLTY